MADHKLNERSFSNFGFSTILIAFVMICIVTFSALALLTANADYRLSKKVKQKATDYYKAEETAYKALAEIDALLACAYRDNSDPDLYLSDALRQIEKFGSTQPDLQLVSDASGIVRYTVAISDYQSLQVILQICQPKEADGHFYKLTTWQTNNTAPTEDNTLHLFGT